MRPFRERGIPWVAEALEASSELELDESKNNVRRKTEPTEALGTFERSVYAVSLVSRLMTLISILIRFSSERLRRGDPDAAG